MRVQAVLEQLERPLLCSSIRAADQMSGELPDAAALLDHYQPRGLAFVVHDARQVLQQQQIPPPTPRLARSRVCLQRPCMHGGRRSQSLWCRLTA